MSRLVSLMIAVAVVLSLGTAHAVDLSRNMSVKLQAGATINAADGDRADLFPAAMNLRGDLFYRVHPNVALVPVSLSWDNFNFDSHDNAVVRSFVDRIAQPGLGNQPVNILDVEGDANGFSYMPGLYFNTTTNTRLNLHGQAGVGFYHFRESFEILNFGEEVNSTDLSSRVSAGIDVDLTDRVSFTADAGYFWVDTDQARDNVVDVTGGFHYSF